MLEFCYSVARKFLAQSFSACSKHHTKRPKYAWSGKLRTNTVKNALRVPQHHLNRPAASASVLSAKRCFDISGPPAVLGYDFTPKADVTVEAVDDEEAVQWVDSEVVAHFTFTS